MTNPPLEEVEKEREARTEVYLATARSIGAAKARHKTANISNLLAIGASSCTQARTHARVHTRERDHIFSSGHSSHACS